VNKKGVGIILIGLKLLSVVIAYGLNQLSNSVKEAASFIQAGGSIGWNEPSIPSFSIVLIVMVIGMGIYLIVNKNN